MRAVSTAALVILGFAAPLLGQGDTASLSAALTARVPGVQVQSRDGSAGAGPVITIRGAAEPLTSARPLLIIDGVRVDNAQGVDNPGQSGHPATARFDDIDPAEIERIEVLPGPAAAALYGPGSGDGVILVTTRRGSTRFLYGSVTAEGGWTSLAHPEPQSYFAWGHTTGGATQQCLTYQAAEGGCVVDSISHFNPVLDARTTPITAGTVQRYGGDVGATVAGIRAYATAHYANSDGNLEMPSDALPPAAVGYHLNTVQRSDVRGQVSSTIGHAVDWGIAGAYSDTHQRVPGVDSMLIAGALGPGSGPPGWPQGSNYPEQLLADLVDDHATHTTGTAYGNWRPISALSFHARVGEDGTRETWRPVPYAGSQGPFGPGVVGPSYYIARGINQFTSDLGGDLTLQTGGLTSRTAVGFQYLDAKLHSDPRIADRTQSAYADETVVIADRLTIDAGARWNHERMYFAHAASTAIDPSLRGRLMLIGRDSTAHVGLRGAVGEMHALPPFDDIGIFFEPSNPICVGSPGIGVSVGQCSGPRFVAEREREAEGGVIAGLADDRLTFDLTVFERRNVHVLVPIQFTVNNLILQADSGAGITRDDGLEITIGARPIITNTVHWDLTFTGFVNQNKLLRLGYPAALETSSNLMRLAAAFPVYGIWSAAYSYADANHDGVIEPSEVTVASSPSYVGPARPTREAALSSSLGLWHGHLTVGALVDYRGGYVLPDLAGLYQAYNTTSRALNVPGASLADQARAIATTQSVYFAGEVQRVNAIRWRELSLSAPLPQLVGSSIRLTVAARNLALWTNYRGPDPDADVTTGNVEQFRLPQPRAWLIRATAAF